MLAAAGRLPRVSDDEPFPFVIVCPQTSQKGDWSADLPRVKSLLDVMVRDQRVDRVRVYITGISQGAIGAWELAAADPGRVAAIVPVSWELPRAARQVSSTPAWVLVGAQDPYYDAERVGQALYAMRARDDRTRFECVPNAKHDASFWNAVYSRPDLYQWLLRHNTR